MLFAFKTGKQIRCKMDSETIALIIVSIFLGVICLRYFIKCCSFNDNERIRNNTLSNVVNQRNIIRPHNGEITCEEISGEELKDEKAEMTRVANAVHYDNYV